MLKLCSRRILVVIFAVLPTVALAGPTAQPFTLGKYVPQDCWMFIHGIHSPERDFIDAHWSRVIEEVKKSGVDAEIKKLILGGVSPADRAGFEQAWNTAVKLFQGVRWGDLVAKEMVFAERLGAITPDLILMFRSAEDSVSSNVQGLKSILDTLGSLSESAAVTENEIDGIKVYNLGAPGFPVSVHLFNKDDIVGIVVGQRALGDVLALMAQKPRGEAIVDSPRFKQAAAELPTPEHAIGFFDFHMLMLNLDSMLQTIFESVVADGAGLDEDALRSRRIISKILDHFAFLDYSMFSGRTEGLSEITTSTTRLRADAMDKPLCKMLTARKPFEKFDKYIPADATGFNVSTSLDLQQLYRAILDFIRDEVPGGPEAMERWANIQSDIEFDVEADLLSWWSGEMVSVNLAPAVKGPFASGDFVIFIRVKNAELATAKVNAGIDRLAAILKGFDQVLMLSEVSDVNAPGFRSMTHPLIAMQGLKFIVGVADGHLVISNSAVAINACLDTAAGKAPSIAENERFKQEGLLPSGPVCGASFTDLSNLGQELGAAFFMMGMVGTFMPDEPEIRPVKAIINMLGRLSPAIAQIDFYSSSASVCTFDGQMWTTTQVMNYKPAPKKPEPAQETATPKP